MENPDNPAGIIVARVSQKGETESAAGADRAAAILHSVFQTGRLSPLLPHSLGPWLRYEEERQPKQSETASDTETQNPKKRRPRGETTCKRLERLHQEDPDFAESASLRAIGRRIGRRAGTIHESTYYKTVLQSQRAELMARKRCARAATKWGHFDSLGEEDEALEGL